VLRPGWRSSSSHGRSTGEEVREEGREEEEEEEEESTYMAKPSVFTST
jgi:hypothetical protein